MLGIPSTIELHPLAFLYLFIFLLWDRVTSGCPGYASICQRVWLQAAFIFKEKQWQLQDEKALIVVQTLNTYTFRRKL